MSDIINFVFLVLMACANLQEIFSKDDLSLSRMRGRCKHFVNTHCTTLIDTLTFLRTDMGTMMRDRARADQRPQGEFSIHFLCILLELRFFVRICSNCWQYVPKIN